MKFKILTTMLVGLVMVAVLMPSMMAVAAPTNGTVIAAALSTPDSPVQGKPIKLDTIRTWIERIATFLITISMVLAVIIIIWGGINYMFARGDDKKVEAATKMIKNGIIGAAVILGVGLILRTLQLLVQEQSFF